MRFLSYICWQKQTVVIKGDKDHIVPMEMAQRLYQRANEPKALYLIPEGGHSNLYQVGGEKYRKIWLNLASHYQEKSDLSLLQW